MKTEVYRRKLKSAGFTMLELIVTIAILSFGIVAVYGAFSPLVKLNNSNSMRFRAMYLGQEGFEVVRNIRDNNVIGAQSWSFLIDACSQGCQADYKTGTSAETSDNQLKPYDDNNFLKINSDGLYSYDAGENTIFKRKITVAQPMGSDVLKINVQIFWDYSGESFNYETVGYLYNWQ